MEDIIKCELKIKLKAGLVGVAKHLYGKWRRNRACTEDRVSSIMVSLARYYLLIPSSLIRITVVTEYLCTWFENVELLMRLLSCKKLIRGGDTGRKLLGEFDLKPRSDFLESNIALSLQQQNRMKEMGTTVRNASSYMEKLKGNHRSDIGSIRIHIEQRIAAMMGYRGGRLEGDEEKLDEVYV
ncbi:hypothetical protein Tco_0299911 [Tanacetum coccineum]